MGELRHPTQPKHSATQQHRPCRSGPLAAPGQDELQHDLLAGRAVSVGHQHRGALHTRRGAAVGARARRLRHRRAALALPVPLAQLRARCIFMEVPVRAVAVPQKDTKLYKALILRLGHRLTYLCNFWVHKSVVELSGLP